MNLSKFHSIFIIIFIDLECNVEDEEYSKVDPHRQKTHAKYSEMVQTFAACADRWDGVCYEEASRMERVVMGCFAGSRNPGGECLVLFIFVEFYLYRCTVASYSHTIFLFVHLFILTSL